MRVCGIDLALEPMAAPLPMFHGKVDAGQWSVAEETFALAGGRLLSLWGSACGEHGLSVSAAYALAEGLIWLELPLTSADASYPDLSSQFPFAGRMQRAAADLCAIAARGAVDARPWLAHGGWPAGYVPLRQHASGVVADTSQVATSVSDYRTGTFPFLHRWRESAETGTTPGIYA
jgi:Ni,Fe-hydrogenase III component G